MHLDRCDRHDKKVLALRGEKGEWRTFNRKNTFKVMDLEYVLKERKKSAPD
jgi:hypothetical protein